MPVLLRDYETRATLNLKLVGATRYASHEASEVLCLAFAVDDQPIKLWLPGDPCPQEWIEAANNPDWIVSAFSDQFERAIEAHILTPRYGWPTVPLARHRCLMASALSCALPESLENVALALSLKHKKDAAGHRNMLDVCKPRKRHKDEPDGVYWHDDPDRMARLYEYCRKDVEAERELYHRIGFLPDAEQAVWILDQEINDRGVYIDEQLANAAIRIDKLAHTEIDAEICMITGGACATVRQEEKLRAWLAANECQVDDIQKETIGHALSRKNISDAARRVLELRRDGAHAATSKYAAMIRWRNSDGRIKGAFQYHGASTGRWAGRGPQLQNLKRIPPGGVSLEAIAAVKTGDLTQLRQLCPDNPLSLVGDIARAAPIPAPGHRFIDADFSGIESRVTAWLAGETTKINQWKKFDETGDSKDEPYYKLGEIFRQPPEQIRSKGKIGDLAFGFAGGKGSFRALAPDDPATDDEIDEYKDAWRRAHPRTVKFWSDMEAAAVDAIRHPDKVCKVGQHISWVYDDSFFLRMRLPSGRELSYPDARLFCDPDGYLRLTYKDNQNQKWVDVKHFGKEGTWKGKLVENAVQAVARDIFAAALPRLESAGYPVVLHLHDEIVAEVPEDFGGIDEFIEIITRLPPWAAGMPIAAKGDVRARFCKIKAAPENCSKIIEQSPEPREAHGLEPEIAAESAITVSPPNNTNNDYCSADNTIEHVANTTEDFRAAIVEAGLAPPESIIADNKLRRFASDGRPGDDAGWYVVSDEGIPSGVFGCWRSGIKVSWRAEIGRDLTAEEIAAHERRAATATRKRMEEEKKNREFARERAGLIWERAAEAPADHPYLAGKGIGPHGLKVHGQELVVPMRDAAGALHSLQFIGPDGAKQFLRFGRKKGCFHILGEPNGELCLAEGFATGATLLEDTGRAVAICFDAGNLPPAARDLGVRFSGSRFIVCADDEAPGLTKAYEAAAILDGVVVVPDFGTDRPEGASDFNDLHRHAGAMAVRACIDRSRADDTEAQESERPKTERTKFVQLDDFRAYMPMHKYIYIPTREAWPGASVDSRIPAVQLYDKDGKPLLNDKGRLVKIDASEWLDRYRPVEQMTWAPGLPMIVRDRVISDGGWRKNQGATCFNLYLPPDCRRGDAGKALPWIEHVEKIYVDAAGHIICWLAHRVQHPEEKINHALVLGGLQGIGKDTILAPVKIAVGPWNFQEVSPTQITGRFNGFLKSVTLRVSEARDAGDADRFKLYDHLKAYIAAPPDVLRVDEKNLREHAIVNCTGVVITTNYKTDGIYLPADDRRHFVGWSDFVKEDFTKDYWADLWGWYETGGYAHVAAYLMEYDISDFDPKAPPPKTSAFWAIVDANRAPEEGELADILDKLDNPAAVTLDRLREAATGDMWEWLKDRKNRRAIPYRMDQCGYSPVRNDAAQDGLWKIDGARQTIYAKSTLSKHARSTAARKLANS